MTRILYLGRTPCCRRSQRSEAWALKIHQRGVQWKQGVVIYMMLCTSLLYNTTPIHCTPLPLHPPVMNTQAPGTRASRATSRGAGSWQPRYAMLYYAMPCHVYDIHVLCYPLLYLNHTMLCNALGPGVSRRGGGDTAAGGRLEELRHMYMYMYMYTYTYTYMYTYKYMYVCIYIYICT